MALRVCAKSPMLMTPSCRITANMSCIPRSSSQLLHKAHATPALALCNSRSLFGCSYGVVLWELITGEAPHRGRMRPLR